MNPDAKEFVPAHILKKRQEDAERLGELTQQLDKVEINSEKKSNENGSGTRDNSTSSSTKVQENNEGDEANKGRVSNDQTVDIKHQNNHSTDGDHNDTSKNDTIPSNGQHPSDGEDDSYLLRDGENLCEFNGEQFIIPGDDEFECPKAGYDFGNAEDNEDEDVCNAFEEFLDNLPNE